VCLCHVCAALTLPQIKSIDKRTEALESAIVRMQTKSGDAGSDPVSKLRGEKVS
jgi:hypothetical protein